MSKKILVLPIFVIFLSLPRIAFAELGDGLYCIKFDGGHCGRLNLGSISQYFYDQNCDGSIEFQTTDISSGDKSIQIERATLYLGERREDGGYNMRFEYRGGATFGVITNSC